MDSSLYRAVNRFADRTSWLHPLAIHWAKQGIAVFALLLLVSRRFLTPVLVRLRTTPLRILVATRSE